MTYQAQLTEWAHTYERRGWRIFPLRPGEKAPAVRDWEQWAARHRAADYVAMLKRGVFGIGIACGPSQLVVIDLDEPKSEEQARAGEYRNGQAYFDAVAHELGEDLPWWTYVQGTPSGGTHLVFTAAQGVELRNTSSQLAPMVDTRAAGGYIVGAPTRLAAGGVYTVRNDERPATLPAWLLTQLAPKPVPARGAKPVQLATGSRAGRYLTAALKAQGEHLRGAAQGQRNHVLYVSALSLSRFVTAGQLTAEELTEHLLAEAQPHIAAGAYTETEARKTIASGLRAGRAEVAA